MSHSSDSDEFYDAEDITPTKINTKYKTKNAFDFGDKKEVTEHISNDNYHISPKHQMQDSVSSETIKDAVELTPEMNFGEGRRRFRELRQFMQTEDDEYGPSVNSTPDSQTSSAEGIFAATSKTAHPFRIIEHDTMSLQSLTSLGRIGRILSGSVDPSGLSLGRESLLSSGMSTSSSTREQIEDPIEEDEQMEACAVIIMQEPDVIASTKANSLKFNRTPSEQTIMTMSQVGEPTKTMESQLPVAPPRRKKKFKNTVPQPDTGQDTSEATGGLALENSSAYEPNVKTSCFNELIASGGIVPLPSPASTIESLTREFQNSLDMTNATPIDKEVVNICKETFSNIGLTTVRHESPVSDQYSISREKSKSETSSRSSTIKSVHSQLSGTSSGKGHSLDVKAAVKGQYVVKPQDEEKTKAMGPTLADLESMEKLKMEFVNLGFETRHTSHVGHSSLGASSRTISKTDKNSKERRKSAGDEELLKQMNMYVRTRTDSGKQLTDMEILEQVTVLNLDTGERVPLSVAEDKLPQCINPLSLHIMRLTSEYVSNSSLYDDDKQRESDDDTRSIGRSRTSIGEGSGRVGEGIPVGEGNDEASTGGIRRKTAKLKRFLGSTVKKTMDKAKSFAAEVSHARHKEDVADIVDEVRGEQNIKLKASNSHKGPYDFDGCVRHVQEFSEHAGPVWCMKFSQCGRLLATAGQDKVLRIWVIRDAYSFFQDMRTKYNADQKSSPTPSQESIVSHNSVHSADDANNSSNQNDSPSTPFMPRPFCTYTGHTSDLLDVSWSKNYFVLSSSMDKTVRLWHISRKECLCCFQHIDFVTAIVFHPRDDRYFLSGSLDGKLRLWNIPDKKVAVWNEVDGQTKLITAANFCQNGKFAVVGSYDGRCIFYTTDQLKYHTQIDVRSTRGKNSTGRKISGIEPMPGEDKILVTSNDSRIRLYDLRDLSLSCKYKGYVNVSSQIKASFSHDGKYIVSGSENQCIYIWKTHHDYSKFTSVRRDRNDFWEGIKAHNAVVTCAVFAPNADNIIRMIEERERAAKGDQPAEGESEKVDDPVAEQHTKGFGGHVLVSADFNGCIKVFVNKTKPKHSSLPASALA